jgi:outer membrane protein
MMAFSVFGQEQKHAHLNLGNILAMMPEVAEAEANMKNLRDSLVQVYEGRLQGLQNEYGAFQAEMAQGNVAPIDQQKKAQEFQQKQQQLVQFEQQIPTIMEIRRQQKLAPILERIDQAVKEVANENGYSMVFDTSGGAMLFAAETEDIMSLVKAKLGL